MKTLLPEIDSADKRFHNGNPATGEQGTRVTDTWLNDVQDRVRDVQAEAHYVLQKAGFTPKSETQTQLYQAIVKIIDDNRKPASTTQKGEVQLSNRIDSDSETEAATPKAVKTIKDQLDSVQRNQANYIPNSKKSNAVNSNSADDVATSVAVKTAYDKAVAADNNANGRVSKSGDTMTGLLYLNAGVKTPAIGGDGYSSQWRNQTAPYLVDNGNSMGNNAYYPFIKGINRNGSEWGTSFSLGYETPGTINTFGHGCIHLIEDNGTQKLWKFEHDGRFVSPGDVVTDNGKSLNNAFDQITGGDIKGYVNIKQGDWSGLDLFNNAGKFLRIEGNPDSSDSALSFVYRHASGENIAVAYLPRRNGTIAFTNEVVADIRLGAPSYRNLGTEAWDSHGAGYVVTGFNNFSDYLSHQDTVYLRAIQKFINGQWVTISNA